MAENLLILTPVEPQQSITDSTDLEKLLAEENFLGEVTDFHGERHFFPGDEFMMLITFMGCSPMIATGEMDKDGEQYCHITIEGPLEQPHYIIGDNVKIPRCPGCGHRFEDYPSLLDSWQSSSTEVFDCPDCNRELDVTQLRWRKCAGFGRLFIKIWGVFESEAVPSPNLISLLKRHTGLEWHHFYIRHN